MEAELKQRLKRIKLVALDVDGVLTDGGMYYAESGEEWKKFNTRDGLGIRLLQEKGIVVALITGEKTRIVERRAAKLHIKEVHQGVPSKLPVIREMLNRHRMTEDEVCYIGDDLGDLEAIKAVGFSVAVADGVPEVRRAARYVTERRGGEGAVREVCDLIVESRDL